MNDRQRDHRPVVSGNLDFLGDQVLEPRIRDRRVEDALGKRALLSIEVIERCRLNPRRREDDALVGAEIRDS